MSQSSDRGRGYGGSPNSSFHSPNTHGQTGVAHGPPLPYNHQYGSYAGNPNYGMDPSGVPFQRNMQHQMYQVDPSGAYALQPAPGEPQAWNQNQWAPGQNTWSNSSQAPLPSGPVNRQHSGQQFYQNWTPFPQQNQPSLNPSQNMPINHQVAVTYPPGSSSQPVPQQWGQNFGAPSQYTPGPVHQQQSGQFYRSVPSYPDAHPQMQHQILQNENSAGQSEPRVYPNPIPSTSNQPQASTSGQYQTNQENQLQFSSNQSSVNYNSQTQAPNQFSVNYNSQTQAPNQSSSGQSSPAQIQPQIRDNSQKPAQEQPLISPNNSISSIPHKPQIGQQNEQPPTSNQTQTSIPNQPLLQHGSPTPSQPLLQHGSPTPSQPLLQHGSPTPSQPPQTPSTVQTTIGHNSITSTSCTSTTGQQEEPNKSNQTEKGHNDALSMTVSNQMDQKHNPQVNQAKRQSDHTERHEFMENKVLVKDLHPDTSSEDLTNYLEAVLNNEVTQVKYTSDRTGVIVTLDERVQDLENIQKRLKGKIPAVSYVRQPSGVAVRCHAKCRWREEVESYFESPESGNKNKRRALKVQGVEDAVVFMFEDVEVVRQIVQKEDHTLCGQEIQVEEFYTEVGCPVWREESRSKRIEIPLSMLQIKLLQALDFIQDFMFKYRGLKVTLTERTAVMEGPVPSVQLAEEVLQNLLDDMKRQEKNAGLSQMKARLLDHEETEAFVKKQLGAKGVVSAWICRQDGDHFDVTVTALSQTDVDVTVNMFGKTLMEADIEAENLSEAEFQQLEEDLAKQNYRNCFFLLHNQGNSVLVVATKSNIESLKTQTETLLKQFERSKVGKKLTQMIFPSLQNECAKFIYKHMKSELEMMEAKWNVKIYRERRRKGITVAAHSLEHEQDIRKAFDDLQSKVITVKVSAKGEYVTMLHKEELLPAIMECVEKSTVCSVIPQIDQDETDREWIEGVWRAGDTCKVHAVCGDVPETFDAIMVMVDSSLNPIGSFSEKVHKKGGRYVQEELDRYSHGGHRLKDFHVLATHAGTYSKAKSIFHTCGTPTYQDFLQQEQIAAITVSAVLDKAHLKGIVSLAIPAFTNCNERDQTIIAKVVVKEIQSFVAKSETRIRDIYLLCSDVSSMKAFETNMNVNLQPCDVQLDEAARMENKPEVTSAREKTDRPLSVHIVTGNISDEKVDVIVNTVGASLTLHQGAISKALLQKGGIELQNECSSRYPKGVTTGDFIRTRGTGELQCREVFHCCLPSKNSSDQLMTLRGLMDKLLKAASASEYTSIALPSLGTGNLGYRVEEVAPILFDCIRIHQKHGSSVKEIRFVIYHKDVGILKEFQKLQKKFEGKVDQPEESPAKPQSYASVTAGGHQGSRITPQRPLTTPQRPLTTPQRMEGGDPPKLKVQVVDGAMADQEVDVIVNSVNPQLVLSRGAVSMSILKKGGEAIQEELLRSYPYGIEQGHFAVSHGGYLKCRNIYHCYVPMWGCFHDDGSGNIALLHSLLLRCLEEASQHNYKSIAFPAFGTGNLNHPRDIVANTMFKAVKGYQEKSRPGCSLRNVFFVVYGKDQATMSAFLKERDNFISPKPLSATPGRTHQSSPVSGKSWQVKDVTITLKQGDVREEQSYCTVISVAHSMDLSDGTISRLLASADRSNCLQKNFKEKRTCFLQRMLAVVSSSNTCAAEVLILLDRDWIHKDPQSALLQCLDIASNKEYKTLAFPILASGGKAATAASMAEHLHSALTNFSNSKPKGLIAVNVVVKEESQVAAFRDRFEKVHMKPRRPAPPIPKGERDSVVSTRHRKTTTTRVEYTVASNNSGELQMAENMLNRLHTQSDIFQEEIFDERLSSMDQANVLKLSALGNKDVKISHLRRQKMVKIEGDSLEACKALKQVLNLISKLPPVPASRKQSNIQQISTSKSTLSSNESPTVSEASSMSVEEGENLMLSMNSKGMKEKESSKLKENSGSPGKNPHSQDSVWIHEDVAEENLHGMGKEQIHQNVDKSEPNSKMNRPEDKHQDSAASSVSKPPKHKRLTDSCVENELDEIRDLLSNLNINSDQMNSNSAQMYSNSAQMHSNSAQMYSNSAQMDSNSAQMHSNSAQMHSHSTQLHSNSPHMNMKPSQMATDESPENTTPITTDTTEQDDPEPDIKVEWFFVNDTKDGRELQSYESMNEKIESAYRRGDPSVVLPGEDEEYVIDFSTMEEYVKGCDEDRVSVVRREIIPESEVSLSAELKDLSGDSKLVLVDRTSEEFDNINCKFLKAAEPTKVSVVKIEKMLNVIVYQNYERKKKWIMRPGALTPGDHAERSLWHGPLSNTDSIVNLSSFGFNRSYCTSGGDLQCGEGVYFYPYIEDIVTKSKMDASGHHHVCLAKVLTGRTEQANTTAEDKRSTPKGFHSVVDLQSMPSKFVIFFDNQALPEYLVTFSVDQMDSRM